jgi:Flp pilus assembly protein TadD
MNANPISWRPASVRTSARLRVAFVCCAALSILAAGAGDSSARTKSAQAPSPEASLRVARAMRASGDPNAALPIYRELAAGLPAEAPLKIELGDALLEANLIDDAIGIYAAAPADGRAQLGLAKAQLALGRPAQALPFAERAVALRPDDTGAGILRGVVLDRLGRHAEAQTSYRAVIARSPQSVAARTDLALSLALTGAYAEALDLLEPIARSANATPQDRQNLAFIYGLKGDTAAARALGQADLDPKTAAANAEFLGLAHERLGKVK